MVAGGRQQGGDRIAAGRDATRWRLAPGVGLLEGDLVGPQGPAGHAYVLVLPDGRRYRVSEPLYRLAELLRGRLSADEIAARLSARLSRPLSAVEVTRLVEQRLVPYGAAWPD